MQKTLLEELVINFTVMGNLLIVINIICIQI